MWTESKRLVLRGKHGKKMAHESQVTNDTNLNLRKNSQEQHAP